MKKFYFFAMMLCGGFALTSCEETEVISSDPANEEYYIVDFEGDYWKALIDEEQYNGPLIYSGDEYKWTDPQSQLSGEVVKADWTMWGYGYGWENGFAISNYINPTASSYLEQLSVPYANGNFAVGYGAGSKLTFADGKAREFVSINLSPVAYAANWMDANGGPDFKFLVDMTFTLEDGSEVTRSHAMALGTDLQWGFETVDLSGIGAATSVTFSFSGSNVAQTPTYVAIDNIVIKK